MTDPYSGGSEVSYNFFKNIPGKNKILFQYSDDKKKHKKVKKPLDTIMSTTKKQHRKNK